MSYDRRRPPDVDGMVSVKIDNLTYRTTPESLKQVFEKYGEVGDVYIPKDRFSQDSRGFGFVRFYDQRDADDAIDAMDKAMLDGREIRVQMAKHTRAKANDRGEYSGRRGRPFQRGRPRRRSYSRSRSRSRSARRRRSGSRSRSQSRDRLRKNRSHSPLPNDSKTQRSQPRPGEKSRSRSNSVNSNNRGNGSADGRTHDRDSPA